MPGPTPQDDYPPRRADLEAEQVHARTVSLATDTDIGYVAGMVDEALPDPHVIAAAPAADPLLSAAMKCAFGHKHPPMRVVGLLPRFVANGRVGPRIYHCARCAAVASHTGDWDQEEYESPQAARWAGQSTACAVCFPPLAKVNTQWVISCSCGWRDVTGPLHRARVIAFVHEGKARQQEMETAGGVLKQPHECTVSRI